MRKSFTRNFDQTVAINLTQADGSLLFNLAWGDAVIMDEASAESAATQPVGTGPFTFDKWVQGDRIEIVKNDNYWGEPVKLDKATFKFISEPTAAYSAILAGDLDAFPNYPAPENLPQLDADPRYSVVLGSTEGETILSTNNAVAPFDDVRVRQGVGACYQSRRDHRWCHVRLRYTHWYTFRAAQSGLCGPDCAVRLLIPTRPEPC